VTRLLDLVITGLLLGAGAALIMPLALVLRALRRPGPRRIVYLGTGQIAQVFPRNGVNLFIERECSDFGGYFEQMWNVHFPAGARGRLSLTPRHHLVDFDVPIPSSFAGLGRAAAALREVAFLLWLLPFLVRTRATVVTATNPYLQGLNAAVSARLLGIPYGVIITRDFDWDWSVLKKQAFASVFPSRRIERAVGRWVLRHADLVLADRRYYRDFAVRSGARPHRAVATRVLADAAFVRAVRDPAAVRARFGLGPGPLLTYVGRLDADKFVDDLVECLALVRRRFPDAKLVCAGTGALEADLRNRAAALGVDTAMHLVGQLGLDDLPRLLASSDVIVAPHMGYTLIEAGLTGTPIASYDYDFLGEVIEDGQSGRLAPLRDVGALADQVCELLAAPEAARAMGARLRDQLLREHSLEAVVPLYRQAYDMALGSAA
jgi:glycosyltransferase involved in cell wall biosynthesis